MNDPFYSNLQRYVTFDKTVSLQAGGDKTVKLIVDTINKFSTSPFVARCVDILSVGNPNVYTFCKRLFQVACINVEYLRDPYGHEIVFTPKLLMQVGKGDCKKFTTFICAVLKAKGIPSIPKVVSYDGEGWEHIYAIVPYNGSYLTLDPVNHQKWNEEVKHKTSRLNYLDGTKSKIQMNKLSLMGNLPNNYRNSLQNSANEILGDLEDISGIADIEGRRSKHCRHTLAGIEADYLNGLNDENQINGEESIGKKKAKTQKKAKRKKLFKKLKSAGLAPARAAFLGLLALGRALSKTPLKINLAKKIADAWQKDNGKKFIALWEKLGGKADKLKKAIQKGTKVQLHGEDFQILGNGDMQIAGIGVVTAAAAGAAIAAATPIVVAFMKLLKKDGHVSDSESADAGAGIDQAEEKVMDADGGLKQASVREFANSDLTRTGIQLDEGGNQATQREIANDDASGSGLVKPGQGRDGDNGVLPGQGRDGDGVKAGEGRDGEVTADTGNVTLPDGVKSFTGGFWAVNTWVKGMALTGLVKWEAMPVQLFFDVLCSGCLVMIAVVTISKLFKLK